MAKYRLLRGTHTVGPREARQTYKAKDPTRNVIESDQNLAAQDPTRFGRINEYDEPQEYRAPTRHPDAPQPNAMPPLTPTTALQTDKAGKTIDDRYGGLDNLSVSELREIAAAEEINLHGAQKKEDILKGLRAAR